MWLASKLLFGFLAFFFMTSGWMGSGKKWRDHKQILKEDLFLKITMTLGQNKEVRHGMEVKTFFFLREHHDFWTKIYFLAGEIVWLFLAFFIPSFGFILSLESGNPAFKSFSADN